MNRYNKCKMHGVNVIDKKAVKEQPYAHGPIGQTS